MRNLSTWTSGSLGEAALRNKQLDPPPHSNSSRTAGEAMKDPLSFLWKCSVRKTMFSHYPQVTASGFTRTLPSDRGSHDNSSLQMLIHSLKLPELLLIISWMECTSRQIIFSFETQNTLRDTQGQRKIMYFLSCTPPRHTHWLTWSVFAMCSGKGII